MTERKPLRPTYDAAVGLDPERGDVPRFAYALAKFTYVIQGTTAVLDEPEPLRHDVWTDEKFEGRFAPGSDYWVHRAACDVIVHGAAFATSGRASSMTVALQVGSAVKRIAVFGKREVTWSQANVPVFQPPEPFKSIPLTHQYAYGGLDARIPIPAEVRNQYMDMVRAGLMFDHPGLYPRNPIGKGYLATREPVKGFELPNLEDPQDLLTPERLVVPSPELWYKQPLPWCYEYTNGSMFPRLEYVGLHPWFPAPDDARLPEVARGYMPQQLGRRIEKEPELGRLFYQEASPGLVIREDLAGRPFAVFGMHPEEASVAFQVPADPRIEIGIEGVWSPAKPVMTNLVVYPKDKQFYVVYCARTPLSRVFIPGIHKNIPVEARINNDAVIRYESPPTIRDLLSAARPA